MLKLTSQKVPILKIAAPLKVLSGRVRVHVPFGRRVGERGDVEDRAGDEEEKRKMLVCHRDKNQSLASVVFSLGDAFALGTSTFRTMTTIEERGTRAGWTSNKQPSSPRRSLVVSFRPERGTPLIVACVAASFQVRPHHTCVCPYPAVGRYLHLYWYTVLVLCELNR